MDLSTRIALILVFLFTVFLIYKRKNLQVQKIISYLLYVVMFRGKFGLKAMDTWAKRLPRLVKLVGIFGIVLGYLGMVLIAILLLKGLWDSLFTVGAPPSVMPILPFKASWSFYVPPLYFIVCIFILAVIHEFAHGLIARRWGIPVKDSGFGFVGLIIPVLPLAFVEPDEKKLKKSSTLAQLSVYSAGPTANILLAAFTYLILLLAAPAINGAILEHQGVMIVDLGEDESYPAHAAGMNPGELILAVDGTPISYHANLTEILKTKGPGEEVVITTNASEYTLTLAEHPNNASQGYVGIYLEDSSVISQSFIDKWGTLTPSFLIWFIGLLIWLIILNLGVGLFNFIPLGPVDGGRILLVTLQSLTTQEKAEKIWKFVSTFFLFILLLNLLTLFI